MNLNTTQGDHLLQKLKEKEPSGRLFSVLAPQTFVLMCEFVRGKKKKKEIYEHQCN